jgi:hypothetical protein
VPIKLRIKVKEEEKKTQLRAVVANHHIEHTMHSSAICMLQTRFNRSVLYFLTLLKKKKKKKKKTIGTCFLIKYELACLSFEYYYRHRPYLTNQFVPLWTPDKPDCFEHCGSMSNWIYALNCNRCDRRDRDTAESERVE